jgi:Domain of unknown function (DUF4124)
MPLHSSFRWLTFALVAACLLPSAKVQAQDIHICIDAKGVKSYQNAACTQQQRTLSVRSYEAKPEDPALAARTAAIQQEMDRRNRSGGKAAAVRGTASHRSGPTPCQAAKAKRESTLKRVGLKRNFDLLSQLDSEVWEACKGF